MYVFFKLYVPNGVQIQICKQTSTDSMNAYTPIRAYLFDKVCLKCSRKQTFSLNLVSGKKNRTSQIYRKKMAALQSALRTILLTAKECNNDEFRLKSLFVHVMKCNAHDSNPEHR